MGFLPQRGLKFWKTPLKIPSVVSEHLVLVKSLYSNLFNVSYDDMNIVYVFRYMQFCVMSTLNFVLYTYMPCVYCLPFFGLYYRNKEIERLINWLFIVWYIYQILNSIYVLTFCMGTWSFVWLFDEWKAWVLSNSQKVHTITIQYRTNSG